MQNVCILWCGCRFTWNRYIYTGKRNFSAVCNFFDPDKVNTIALFGRDYSIATIIAGLALTVCVGLVVIGGLKRIASVSQVVVPFMAIIYFVFAFIVIVTHITALPAAIVAIVKSAFTGSALAGGAAGTMVVAMQKGIARGIFSNEAGLGSAPIAAAAAQTHSTVRQGLVSMTGTFIDTIVICKMTGLTIVITGTWNTGFLKVWQLQQLHSRKDSVPSGCCIFSTDGMFGIFCIYHNSWMELLW